MSSASPEELEHLAGIVEEKLAAMLPPGRPLTPQAMLLVALALAHDVEHARRRIDQIRTHSKAAIAELLEDVDATLALAEETLGDGTSPPSP